MTWLLGVLGGVPGTANLLWGGFLSCISEFTLVGGMIALYRKHNCHSGGCWRIGRHVVDGTPWCDHHHQDARGGSA